MSQQINLYDPALLRKREWLTATNIAAASGALLLVLGLWGGVARSRLAALEGESRALAPQVQALQLQKEVLTAQLNAMKPNQQLEDELTNTRALLDLHKRQVSELKRGIGTESSGFGEYLRGIARQTPSGLWLTGFAIGDGGSSMEIRGRMLEPALLPEYIHRLDGEPVFKGREFSALKLSAGKLDAAGEAAAPAAGQAPAAAAAPAASGAPPFYDFMLAPMPASAPEAAAGGRR